MKKRVFCYLAIFFVLALAALACIGDPAISYDDQTATASAATATWSADATATFGAEVFYTQLTAQATQKP